MTRGNIRAATSLVLIPVLVLQAACVHTLGPPEPLRPEDNDQLWTLHDAPKVDVVLIDGNAYLLRGVVVENERLRGLYGESRVVSFPLDSIQSVQAYVDDTPQNAMIIGAIVTVVGVLVLLNNLPSCIVCGFEFPDPKQ